LAHFRQFVGLLGSWNSPLSHCEVALHAVLPVPNEYVPAAHGRQLVAPVLGWYVPAGHGSHVDWLPWGVATLWERVPTGQLLRWHALSDLAPSCEVVDPVGHFLQSIAPSRSVYQPIGHLEQAPAKLVLSPAVHVLFVHCAEPLDEYVPRLHLLHFVALAAE